MCPMIQISQYPRGRYEIPILQMGRLRTREVQNLDQDDRAGSEPPGFKLLSLAAWPCRLACCDTDERRIRDLAKAFCEPALRGPTWSRCSRDFGWCPVFILGSLWPFSIYKYFLAVPGGTQPYLLGPSGLLPLRTLQMLGAKAVSGRTEAWWHLLHRTLVQ